MQRKDSFFWKASLVITGLFAFDLFSRWVCFNSCAGSGIAFVDLVPFANNHFVFGLVLPVWVMYVLYVLALAVLFTYSFFRWPGFRRWQKFCMLLVYAGAIANIGDRLVFGYVRDFIKIGTGYINLGDVYILVGVLCLVLIAPKKV